ncbi:adenylate/guanylate cyclase domain-containing protein [Stappia sp. ES.058]|uniref:adenylate/guanylate cyclase domain-containing protein n=1 Tax=Stappia sp. ES.058 TaxID=1881061 RepID=UPI00087AC3B3|nr:adenylate/guanylate cyclase domain-containing protein [Stappia sp. ES.058]SDU37898.1 adenylate cyclase [Stappia sp. ES.058]
MRTSPEIEDIEDWLIREALGQPDIGQMFAGTCERMRAAGIAVDRALLSWSTLHPLVEAETALWLPGETVDHGLHTHDQPDTDDWLLSPIRALLTSRETRMRRRLADGNAPLEFPMLGGLRDQGFTDYLVISTPFDLPSSNPFDVAGIIVTWSTRTPGGFAEDDIERIDYLQMRLALACRANVQSRIARTIAETYLGKRAGGQVISGRIRHGDGETLDAVIFYSDLRGSTALADRLAPDAYLAHLNTYFEATAGAVIAHGGEVLDFIGDAVLAVFPIDQQGLQAAACNAMDAVAEVRRRLASARKQTPHPLACGMALSSGRVIFGNIGVAERLTFSVIGPTVNAAARIETMTKRLDTEVLVTAEIALQAPERFRAAGRYPLDGISTPVELYALSESALKAP